MYREELAHQRLSTLQGIGIVVLIFFVLFTVAFFVEFTKFVGLVWPQFVLYALVVVGTILLFQKGLTDYVYVIGKDRVSFGRRIGKREKELLFVPLRDIVRVGSYAQLRESCAGKKIYRYSYRSKEHWQVLLCEDVAVVLTASDRFFRNLKDAKNGKEFEHTDS